MVLIVLNPNILMKPSNDQKTILSLLDISGSCITDIFYNHLYDRAIAVHEKTSKGLTECYREAIKDYVGESSSPKFYTLLLNSIHHYVRMTTIYSELSYTDCIALYANLFVPSMYINSLTIEQKVNIVSMILGNVVKAFADEIIQQQIAVIIDDHGDSVNIEVLQDAILKILLDERELSYDRFIQSQKPKKKVVIVDTPNSSPPKAMVKITTAFKKSVADRASLKKRNNALQKKNKALAEGLRELKAMLLNQINTQKEQSATIDELKVELQKSTQTKSMSSNMTQTEDAEDAEDAEDDNEELFSVQYVGE